MRSGVGDVRGSICKLERMWIVVGVYTFSRVLGDPVLWTYTGPEMSVRQNQWSRKIPERIVHRGPLCDHYYGCLW